MRFTMLARWLASLAVVAMVATPVQAEHRARRLGDPATRFAPRLTRPEQLRALLTDERMRADIVSILRQAGWKGDVEDLRRAAANAPMTELKMPKGTRMPYMSSRKDGKPVTLIDVLWVGEEPIDAYAFEFSSKGRRYRCVTPKLCSNFFTVDLGPEPAPKLQLRVSAPAESSVCDPIEIQVEVRNNGTKAATGVRVTNVLPDGLKLPDGRTTVVLEAGDLAPGSGKLYTLKTAAAASGAGVHRAAAASAEGLKAEASAATRVNAPVLALECEAPAEVFPGRPVEVCIGIRNTGGAADEKVTVTLPIPAGVILVSAAEGGVEADGRVVWELPGFQAGANRSFCAVFRAAEPVMLSFTPSARGLCAPAVATECATRVPGIAAVLLEVIDLEDPIRVGDAVTYNIQVLNQGSAALTNVRLVSVKVDEQEAISGTGATAVTVEGGSLVFAALPVLEAKAEAMWRVMVTATKAGDARFRLELTADQLSRPVTEFESTQQY